MKTHQLLAVIALVVATVTPKQIFAQNETKEQINVPLTDPGKPGTLQVKVIRGSIHVIGYSGKDVMIEVSSKAIAEKDEPSRDEAAKGMKRINGGRTGLELTVEEEKNTVSIKPSFPRNPIHLTIKVPQSFALNLGAINEGDVIVDNVNGEFEIANVNGAILLNNISGSVVANTVNGNVKGVFKAINPDAPMAFSTLNGNIDITFPTTAKFDVKMKSDRGEIYSDFDIDVDKTQPKAVRSASNGLYKVTISDWVQGKINGGGKEVMMKNMNGNLYIRKAK